MHSCYHRWSHHTLINIIITKYLFYLKQSYTTHTYCDILSVSCWQWSKFCCFLCHATPQDYFLSKNVCLMCSFCPSRFLPNQHLKIYNTCVKVKKKIPSTIFTSASDILNDKFCTIQMGHFKIRLEPSTNTYTKWYGLFAIKYNILPIMLWYNVCSTCVLTPYLVSFKVVLMDF